MHYINKIIHVCVAFQAAFQGASGAILRGRTTSADSVQLPASNLDSLSLAAEDLDNQLDSFLRSWGGGHRKPDIVEIANIAKRQTGSIQISSEELQNLLRLIQSIAQQISAIIESGGISASGTVAPPTSSTISNTAPVSSASEIALPPVSNTVSNTGPVSSASETTAPPVSNTVSNTGPVSSSPAPSDVQSTDTRTNPAATGVSAPTPSPFLTTSGADSSEPLTTIYATSVATTTRCKTTVTQTFTETVFEDGPSAVPRAVRAVVEDDDDIDGPDPRSTNDVEQDDDWEPWVRFDGTTVEEDGSDVGFTPRDTWTSLGVTRRSPAGVSLHVETLFSRDEQTL
ncbi:hypothetical protein LX32DRAFT_374640 [Colletotrichum zoysiae]|uniref:Uncharacterized protein n=1 Tax=Colletotrichum zoysiae TaxID=1216348 RepID=A0AAD9HVG6_9PEZI|nr:hypothetical protein LX32DRAFT_374640 [Colletotrichum zoysiae]